MELESDLPLSKKEFNLHHDFKRPENTRRDK